MAGFHSFATTKYENVMKKYALVPDTLFVCFRRQPELLSESLPAFFPEFQWEFQSEFQPGFPPKLQPGFLPVGKTPARRLRNILPRTGNYSGNLLLN